MTRDFDIRMMHHALELAERGMGWTSPNPMVGAVVCQGDEIISEGYHARCGEAHAERIALDLAGERARGGTLYVTLEPCAHHGRTPPCLDRVIESGVKRVVAAMRDPNPYVNGRSIRILREKGIAVDVGICEEEASRLNHPFLSNVLRKRPWVTIKYAMTLDGRISTSSGDSKWISGEESRQFVQEIRRRNRSILVGYRTLAVDDPLLTCRIEMDPPPRQPIRIVIGGVGPLPSKCQLAMTSTKFPTMHVLSGKRWKGPLNEPSHVEGVVLPGTKPILEEFLELLHQRDIDSLLVEGGAQTLAGFMDAGLVDEVFVFVAPKLVCDSEALSPIPGSSQIQAMADARGLHRVTVSQRGDDALVHGYLTEFQNPLI